MGFNKSMVFPKESGQVGWCIRESTAFEARPDRSQAPLLEAGNSILQLNISESRKDCRGHHKTNAVGQLLKLSLLLSSESESRTQGRSSWTQVSVVFTPSLTSWWDPLSEESRETLRTRKCLTLLTNIAHPHHHEHVCLTQGEMAICLWTFHLSQVYMPLRVSFTEIWEKYKQWNLRRLVFNGRTDQLPLYSYLLPHPPLTKGCWKLALELSIFYLAQKQFGDQMNCARI